MDWDGVMPRQTVKAAWIICVHYAFKEFDTVPHDFRGPVAMYEKCGFIKCAEREGKIVVRKALGGNNVR